MSSSRPQYTAMTLVVVLVSEHALDRLLVDVTHFLEPVNAIYSFKPKTFGRG